MPKLRYRTKVDLCVAAGTIAIGAFFLYQASLISTLSDHAVGPSAGPAFLALSMMGMGALIAVLALTYNSNRAAAEASDALHANEPEEEFGFRDADLKRVIAVVALGFLYIVLFHALGYLISTLAIAAMTLWAFGNRRLGRILVLATAGAFAYDHVFMALMGLHDPAGAYFDLEAFLANPSWDELVRKLPKGPTL